MHFHIDSDASTDQVFRSLDTVLSYNEDEIDNLMNDFDKEFIAPEEIKLVNNPGNVSALTLEPNVLVVGQGATHNKEREKNKNSKKSRGNHTNHMQLQSFSTFWR